jgi:hypothetical protein
MRYNGNKTANVICYLADMPLFAHLTGAHHHFGAQTLSIWYTIYVEKVVAFVMEL